VLLDSCNAHTFVGGQERFIARTTLAIAPGEKVVHKRVEKAHFFFFPGLPAPLPFAFEAAGLVMAASSSRGPDQS
jgi:hypothetical protein